jgi:transposase-like protein
MAKSPHTPEFRAQVSQEYLDGLSSTKFLARKYRVDDKTIRE